VLDGKVICTCQPIPRLRTEGGIGVALAYLETAMNAPVDYRDKSHPVSGIIIISLYKPTYCNNMQEKLIFLRAWNQTSTRATKDAAIMANASPASKVGAPH
jgi:hypothetical protein